MCSLLDEVGVVEAVTLSEMLLHLVELEGADSVEVGARQLLLKHGGVMEAADELAGALDVVRQQPLIRLVLEAGLGGSLLFFDSFVLCGPSGLIVGKAFLGVDTHDFSMKI